MSTKIDLERYWLAVISRDQAYDGVFFYGVVTSGVYCAPSCPSRQPLRENVRFYPGSQLAELDGFRACKRCQPNLAVSAMDSLMHDICRYIQKNNESRLTLKQLAEQAGMSPSHFQRRFKKSIGISPKKYQEACRINAFKSELKQGSAVSTAYHQVGYESSSRIYEKLDTHMGMTPGSYRKGGAGERISYASAETCLGLVMIAATDRGICFLQFADNESLLLGQLKSEYPKADISPMPKHDLATFADWMRSLRTFLDGSAKNLALPLDIRGTAFQRLVWEYLMTIPIGDLQSYSEVAKGIGKPKAVRAVATACANNAIAIAIPCHRVIRGDGQLAGYKWGMERKRTLIDIERKENK